MADLHITNGDGAANIIKASAVVGDVLPWRDPMHHGPFPADLDLAQLSEIRARHCAGLDVDASEARRDFQLRDDHLRAARKYDRVVLWFEHDLLDQLQVLQLLDWFAQVDLGSTQLEIICINTFPEIVPFRGIGQLNVEQMASLYDGRQPVTRAQLDLATAAWAAFRSTDPNDLAAILSTDLTPLPFLHAAVSRHFEEYPSYRTGLTRTEHQILELVATGVSDPGEIFLQNMDRETALFIGDWPSFRCIDELCSCEPAILSCDTGTFWLPPQTRRGRDAFRSQRLLPTQVGQMILSGERDAFELVSRDLWLGGVHIQSGMPMWTWDEDSGHLKLRDAK